MIFITFPVLIYLITGSLYLLIAFIQLSFPPIASGNHKFYLFLYEFTFEM